MIRSFMMSNKNEYQPGQVVRTLDQTPSPQKYDRFKLIRMTAWDARNQIGEFKVKSLNRPQDPDHLKGWVR